jgi:C4-dicarboxylate transporter DctQ subunit
MSFYEATDIPMVGLFSFLEGWINYGESYEKLPKVIPYIVLPIASLLLLLRFAQAALAIWRGELEQVVASHEVDELDNDSAEARR